MFTLSKNVYYYLWIVVRRVYVYACSLALNPNHNIVRTACVYNLYIYESYLTARIFRLVQQSLEYNIGGGGGVGFGGWARGYAVSLDLLLYKESPLRELCFWWVPESCNPLLGSRERLILSKYIIAHNCLILSKRFVVEVHLILFSSKVHTWSPDSYSKFV